MKTDAELDAVIADLEALLDSGASGVTRDGVVETFDRGDARVRLAELKRQRRVRRGGTRRHPYASPTFGGC